MAVPATLVVKKRSYHKWFISADRQNFSDSSSLSMNSDVKSTETVQSSVECTKRILPSNALDEKALLSEEISAETLLEESVFCGFSHGKDLVISGKPSKIHSFAVATVSGRLLCSFCELYFTKEKLRKVSNNPEQNVILLSCLVMDNTIEVDVAIRIWKEICHSGKFTCSGKLICKHHYVQAVSSCYTIISSSASTSFM